MVKTSSSSSSCRLLPLKSSLSSLYFLTSFFGHKNCFHRNRFSLGLSLWITNILIHFAMEFYGAYAIFGVAWATAVGMYLITFVTASSWLAKVALPWLEESLMLLYEAGSFSETLRRVKIILRPSCDLCQITEHRIYDEMIVPVIVICMGCAGGAGQYTCHYVDGATRLDFSNVLPHWLAIVVNVVRFTSLIHTFCGYSLFMVVPVCVMMVSLLSMKEFKGFMDKEFKNSTNTVTFGTAVTLFEERASFVRNSSKSCSMMLAILVVSSTLSFTLNVYNFLFVQRLAIYCWFAVLPLFWVAIPLVVAAWVTETYETFAGVVLKNWAQTSGDDAFQTTGEALNSGIKPEVTCITCRSSLSKVSQRKKTGHQYARRKFRKNLQNVIRPFTTTSSPQNGNTNVAFHTDLSEERRQNSFAIQYELTTNFDNLPNVTIVEPTVGQQVVSTHSGQHNGQPAFELAVSEQRTGQQLLNKAVATSTSCNNSQSTPTRFDFERYIIYLQCLLPEVGFSVAGCLLTWDKVFALAVFMISLAAVFIQEVMFGSRKNTIGRP